VAIQDSGIKNAPVPMIIAVHWVLAYFLRINFEDTAGKITRAAELDLRCTLKELCHRKFDISAMRTYAAACRCYAMLSDPNKEWELEDAIEFLDIFGKLLSTDPSPTPPPNVLVAGSDSEKGIIGTIGTESHPTAPAA